MELIILLNLMMELLVLVNLMMELMVNGVDDSTESDDGIAGSGESDKASGPRESFFIK